MENASLNEYRKNDKVYWRVKGERKFLHTIKREEV
jgi:hypothetical protein